MITDKEPKQHGAFHIGDMAPFARRRRMKARTRFLKSVISTAKSNTTKMPWERGATRRATLQARRDLVNEAASLPQLKRA